MRKLGPEEVARREVLEQLVSAIAALPPSQRAVIYLRDIRGLTCKEVCQRLAISDVTQRVRLRRARTAVREAIFGTGDDRPEGLQALAGARDEPA